MGLSGSSRQGTSPLEVVLLRNGIAESLHRAHAVVTDQRGRLLMRAGDPQHLSFIRSSLKPFQAQLFVSSGAVDAQGVAIGQWQLLAPPTTAPWSKRVKLFRCFGEQM